MQELVDVMGVSRASLYATYGDKRELFEKAFKVYVQRNAKTLERYFQESQTEIKQKFEALFEQNLAELSDDTRKRGCFAVNTATECTLEDVDFLALVNANNVSILKIFKGALEEAQKKGEIAKDKNIDSIAQLFFTQMNGIRVLSKVNPDLKQLRLSLNLALSVFD